MNKTDRRFVLKAGLTLASLPVLGGLNACSREQAAVAEALPSRALSDRVTLITGAPGNVLALSTGEGLVLVDSGSAALAPSVAASLGDMPVTHLFNTHYHRDQTGGNALFGERGVLIRSHEITRQWVATDFYVPAEDRWEPALSEAAQPAETFRDVMESIIGAESIESGYLLEAHTRGDAYVWFRDSNVLAVGDVASPERDPMLDWYAGGWLGGRVDAMDDLLRIANDETQIVPAYGPVMSKAELQAERDMMMHLYTRTTDLTASGRSARDMLEEGVMDEIERQFKDPYQFLYDVAKGHWAHYTNFGGSIV